MNDYGKLVEVEDLFTRTHWFRRIGKGPWENVDLTVYNGIVPVAWFTDDPSAWQINKTLVDPRVLETEPR